jgi:hypothetical protein
LPQQLHPAQAAMLAYSPPLPYGYSTTLIDCLIRLAIGIRSATIVLKLNCRWHFK